MNGIITKLGPAEPAAKRVHFLHPGDIACVEHDERLETLLGSCVAVILTDPQRTIGAMCHIVHSKPAVGVTDKACAYADAAIDGLYRLLRKRGFSPRLCEAFVYGGGNMFPERFTQSHVGDANGRWVLDRLQCDGVRVIHDDLGGTAYRRLAWTVGSAMPVVVSVSMQGD